MFIDERDGFIYTITCKANGRIYVGSTSCPPKRFGLHTSDLNLRRHANEELQSDWNQYGENLFSFSVLTKGTRETEKRIIILLRTGGLSLYNVPAGVIAERISKALSEPELRRTINRKLSEAAEGRYKDPQYHKMLSLAVTQALQDSEVRKRLIEGIERRSQSLSYRRKLSTAAKDRWKDHKARRRQSEKVAATLRSKQARI